VRSTLLRVLWLTGADLTFSSAHLAYRPALKSFPRLSSERRCCFLLDSYLTHVSFSRWSVNMPRPPNKFSTLALLPAPISPVSELSPSRYMPLPVRRWRSPLYRRIDCLTRSTVRRCLGNGCSAEHELSRGTSGHADLCRELSRLVAGERLTCLDWR